MGLSEEEPSPGIAAQPGEGSFSSWERQKGVGTCVLDPEPRADT